jgi:hypothetical protein
LRQIVVILFAMLADLSASHGSTTKDWVEPNPHWAAFKTPRYDKLEKARIALPPGYRLCSTAESYSNLLWFYIPLDKAVRCEDLPKDADWEKMPDFIVVAPSPDSPMLYKTTADFVKDEPFFCHGVGHGDPSHRKISSAPTSIESAGKALAGLETTACTREDAEKDRYTKALLAYRPDAGFIGHEYMIAANVHISNKREADKLLEEIVKLFKLLK